MSKEYLDALEIIGKLYLINDEQVRDWDKRDFNILKSALKRLESIDNANPSEALEELNILRHLEIGFDKNGEPITLNDTKGLPIIKDALLKAQEPKKYLKWEDLEFKGEEQTMKVKLNNKIYTMFYCSDEVCFDTVSIAGVFIDSCSQQFFNDLRLERVEE